MPTTGSTGTINLTTKASDKVLERFKIGSCTEGLFSNEYNWTGVKTVQIYSIDTLPVNNYNPERVDGGSRYGNLVNVGDTMQEFSVTQNKSFIGTIDESYNTNQMQIKSAGRILRRETDEVLIPMVDKYRLGMLLCSVGAASYATFGNTEMTDVSVDTNCVFSAAASAYTKANIIENIMTANAVMSDQLVPDTGRVLYMTYKNAVALKLADQVVGIDKLGEKSIVNGAFGKIDKCQIRLVPESYLPTDVMYMIVKTGIALAPQKIKKYEIHDGAHILDGKIVTGHLMHDCFVLAKGPKDSTTGKQVVRGIVVAKKTT
jgi:hypothetical protein